MDTLTSILRAAHCKSTHHYFAIDALPEIPSRRGKSLANLLLVHFGEYLKGAKDPDNVFKDFENHVLHVRDGYWGGAAQTAEKWLANAYKLLNSGKWSEAAYALGVLSHYFTDPFMPLHTAQSPRETIVHRPLEWSVCCAYSEIFDVACSDSQLESFDVHSGSDWMKDGVMRGATMANKYYEAVIDDYDMNESGRNPKLALGTDSKRILAKIFVWVLTGWGQALDRIANECSAQMPELSLTIPTLLAGVQIPFKKIAAKIESIERRKEVEGVLEEYLRTGNVVHNVSLEQSTVQRLQKTKPELRPTSDDIERIVRIHTQPKAIPQVCSQPKPIFPNANVNVVDALAIKQKLISEEKPIHSSASTPPSESITANDSKHPLSHEPTRKRSRLTLANPIVDAPAIGPKTAARFIEIGCESVGDFIAGDPEKLSAQLATKWITPRLVSQWQAESQLACDIERLTASGSGLLIMVGIGTAMELSKQNASALHSLICAASETTEGKRLLRDKAPPPLKSIQEWIDSACKSKAL